MRMSMSVFQFGGDSIHFAVESRCGEGGGGRCGDRKKEKVHQWVVDCAAPGVAKVAVSSWRKPKCM